jgi:cytochrome P450
MGLALELGPMFRFTIRELLLMMAVVALGVGWVTERKPLISQNAHLQQQNVVLLDHAEKLRRKTEEAEEMRDALRAYIQETRAEQKKPKPPPNQTTADAKPSTDNDP